MTALTKDRYNFQLVAPNVAIPPELPYLMEAAVSCFAGGLIAIDAAGFAVAASSGTAALAAQRIVGVCKKQTLNTTAAGYGAQGALTIVASRVPTGMNNSGAGVDLITQAMAGLLCYAVDDNVVAATDGGGLRPCAGVILGIDPVTLAVMVQPGMPSLYAVNTTLSGQEANGQGRPNTARLVASSIGVYTGTGTGVLTITTAAVWTIDNKLVALNDQIFLPPGLTNLAAIDSGTWVVSVLGTSSVETVLKRPSWFEHGAEWTSGQEVHVGGEGAVYFGTTWVATAAAGVIDTTDPAFFCREFQCAVTLGGTGTGYQTLIAGQPLPVTDYPLTGATTVSHCPIGLMPLAAAGAAPAQGPQILASLQTKGGTATLTVGYGIVAAPTPGYVGTSACTINAIAAGQAASGDADTSTVLVTFRNPC